MRAPLTINFNDAYDLDKQALDEIRKRASQNRQSLSKAAMILIMNALELPVLHIEYQPDPVDVLVAMIADLQAQVLAMGHRIQDLSARQSIVFQSGAGEMAPIDAIGESIVYDTAQNREEVPISDEFKRAIIEAAGKRARGMGKASHQIEAPLGSLRGG